ncbi:hypothetical protein RIF29_40947 [Crotalaria pallida]|uniref:Uncharacterized protein n=1 Tax=Crotalaria pallida TaxID=3830 RepID=A0AAN9E419_CROPI
MFNLGTKCANLVYSKSACALKLLTVHIDSLKESGTHCVFLYNIYIFSLVINHTLSFSFFIFLSLKYLTFSYISHLFIHYYYYYSH